MPLVPTIHLEGRLGLRLRLPTHGSGTLRLTAQVLRCWGPGTGIKHQETKEAIQKLLREYGASFDMEEASR